MPKSGKARRVEMSRQLTRVLADRKSFQEAEAALAGHAAPTRVFQHPGTATPMCVTADRPTTVRPLETSASNAVPTLSSTAPGTTVPRGAT